MNTTEVTNQLDQQIVFDGKGGATICDINQKNQPLNSPTWLSLSLNTASDTLTQLTPSLNPFTCTLLTTEDVHTGLWQDDQGLIGVVRCATWNDTEQAVTDFISIRFFVCADYFITVQKHENTALAVLFERLRQGHGPKTPVDCLIALLLNVQHQLTTIMVETDDAIDEFEEHLIFPSRHTQRREISELRYRLISLRRYVAPQRETLIDLIAVGLPTFFSAKHKLALKQITQGYHSLMDKVELGRERTKILQDEFTALMQDKMNQKMYLLSVIAVIAIPIGLITGLLGINVGGIPGAQSSTAFWWVCVGLIGFVSLVLGMFKWRKWL